MSKWYERRDENEESYDRMIKQWIKQREVKVLSNLNDVTVNAAGDWICETFGPLCTKGNGYNERIGQKTTVQSIAFRFIIKLSAAEATGTSVRVILGCNHQVNHTDTTPTMLLEHPANEINSGYVTSPRYRGRIHVFKDKVYEFGSTTMQRYGKHYVKGPIKVEYNGNDFGTVADLEKNSFFIMAMAESNDAAILIRYGYTIRFTDD